MGSSSPTSPFTTRPPLLALQIVQCEIDERVVAVSKQFLGHVTAKSFNDPRVALHFMDAAEYMKAHAAEFDVIIVDSSDPVGPAETLYTSDFYRNMHQALRPNGIVCTQGECMWLHLDLIHRVMTDAKAMYPTVDYGYSCVPTYPSGQIGFIIATKMAEGECGWGGVGSSLRCAVWGHVKLGPFQR